MAKILVIDDEPNLRLLLDRLLSGAGFEVVLCETGMSGLSTALAEDFDLIVLDLTLPDVAGEYVLHMIMSVRPTAKVVVLSAVTEVGRRVAVLSGGAADFVAKPCSNAELLARIRLHMRGELHRGLPTATSIVKPLGIELDFSRRVLVAGGKRIRLSQREFVLLAYLLDRKGAVCTRQELLVEVWDMPFDPGTNVVDVCVRRLRAKLAENTIETIRNVGYRLVA